MDAFIPYLHFVDLVDGRVLRSGANDLPFQFRRLKRLAFGQASNLYADLKGKSS
jgi:hypothetical protein